MALSAQAALLDELMGKNRNAAPGEAVKDCHFTDPDVCKHFLCGFCPHELFVNTRADLGPCDKIHDDNLKRQYEKSSRKGRLGYEEDFEQLLRSLLADVEKRIKKGRDRLSLTQGSDDKYSSARQERINALNEQINTLISEADQLGREGSVDAAKEALEKCERLKIERLDLETRHTGENAKAMEVCNVCGSFLIVGDAQCRVEEHITGKQHVGFAKIRSTIEQLRANRQKAMEERMKARETEKTRNPGDVRKSAEKRTSRHRSGSRHMRRDVHHGNDKSPPAPYRHHRHRQESRHRSKTGGSRVSPHGGERRRKSNSESTAAANQQQESNQTSKPPKADESEAVRRRSRSTSNRRRSGKGGDASAVSLNDRETAADKQRRTSMTRQQDDTGHKKRHSHQRSHRRRSGSLDEDMEEGSSGSKRRSSRDKTSSKHKRRLSPPEKRKSTSHYKSPERQRGKNSKIRHSSSSSSSSSASESDASSSRRRRRKEPQRKTRRNSSSSSSSGSMSVDKSE